MEDPGRWQLHSGLWGLRACLAQGSVSGCDSV